MITGRLIKINYLLKQNESKFKLPISMKNVCKIQISDFESIIEAVIPIEYINDICSDLKILHIDYSIGEIDIFKSISYPIFQPEIEKIEWVKINKDEIEKFLRSKHKILNDTDYRVRDSIKISINLLKKFDVHELANLKHLIESDFIYKRISNEKFINYMIDIRHVIDLRNIDKKDFINHKQKGN